MAKKPQNIRGHKLLHPIWPRFIRAKPVQFLAFEDEYFGFFAFFFFPTCKKNFSFIKIIAYCNISLIFKVGNDCCKLNIKAFGEKYFGYIVIQRTFFLRTILLIDQRQLEFIAAIQVRFCAMA